jgi:NDP-sugar pyrophosphorylase family protein
MQIIIPMSGTGQRFINAGYTNIKPLIVVDGKPIIEHVVNLFPGEENFIFICRSEHLEETALRDTLMTLRPKARIISVEGAKLGPVHAVLQASEAIDDGEPTIVNYCDFFMDCGLLRQIIVMPRFRHILAFTLIFCQKRICMLVFVLTNKAS